VLTGRVSELAWWGIVAGRLGAGPGLVAELRRDLEAPVEVTICVIPAERVEIITPLERDHTAQWPLSRQGGPHKVS